MARPRWLGWAPLVAVMAVALFFNVWGLTKTGYGNTYYAAAVRSMTESWHNFFFVAFDPGGFISVDKPPVFLWVDALFVRAFGYSSLTLLLPSAIAGTVAVGLLWLVARRYFGVLAATIAAMVLAVTPIAVAVNRLNLPEPFYILALIGAAACILRSLDSKRWLAWTISAGILVGVAFNTKMLAAWIPGPALALAIVVGVEGTWRTSWRHYLPRLLAFGAVTLIASAAWMLAGDQWPSSDRACVGGSDNHTVEDLIVGYNGLNRVEGGSNGPSGGGRPVNNTPQFAPPNRLPNGANQPRPAQNFGIQGPGGIIAGSPDLFRMFDSANGGQIAWFLPFALIRGVVSLWRWRDNRVLRAAIVLFLGWTVLFGGVFSYTQGIYHSYYTSALAPGIAALVGISVLALSDLLKRHWAWLIVIAAMALTTLSVQMTLSGRFENFYNSLRPYTTAIVIAGLAASAIIVWQKRLPTAAGLSIVVAGLLLLPAAWSSYETAHASLNTTLPQAGPRQGVAGRSFGSNAFDSGVSQLAKWLEAHRDTDTRWDLVVTSAQSASTLIAEYNVSVLPIGGFSGSDPTLTAEDFGALIAKGEVRYVLMTSGFGTGGFPGVTTQVTPNRGGSGRNGGFRDPASAQGSQSQAGANAFALSSTVKGANAVMTAVRSACTVVPTDITLPQQYRGSLYDCAGAVSNSDAR
jgi:4-amino-4-deoxy-L-arabinose transferase-like glycosyltransferase